MVNKYVIRLQGNKLTLREWLEKLKVGKPTISKLNTLNAICNNKESLSLDYNLKNNEIIYINFSLLEDNDSITNYDYKLNILYEDDNIIAVDKERGILVHSDGNNHETLLNGVCTYLKNKCDDSFVRPIHRIDVETSGVVVFAKNIIAYNYLSYQMENRLIEKEYLAYVDGYLPNDGVVKLYISRDRHNAKKYVGFPKDNNNAETIYKVIKHTNSRTLLSIIIYTGKPHQIRVSMAYLKHPVSGDKLYGHDGKVMYLLAYRIKFNLFDKEIEIKSKKDINYL